MTETTDLRSSADTVGRTMADPAGTAEAPFDPRPVTEPPAVHAWMPASPCGAGCVAVPDTAGAVRSVVRIAGVLGLLVAFPMVNVVTPAARRTGLHRRYARAVLRCCGIALRVVDERGADAEGTSYRTGAVRGGGGPGDSGRGLLVVAGHVGWADVLALAAVSPMGFVARGDLVSWPVLGQLARLMRVIPIDRERLRQLPEVIAAMSARLAAGERVGMFPEGTTWCGRAHGRLRPALFQAAVDTATPVQPIRLRYLDPTGETSTVPGFVGVDTFIDSARRVLRAKGIVAELVLLPIEEPGSDRHDLAERCDRAIRGRTEVRIDAHATAIGTGPTREIVVAEAAS
ncbi:lysophospholipid acyltransferase family protein [Nocardia mikamii]|uniref:lysophospholipid acyltransferase family protein n=1 Tax=Nocardia mikamii TaxID=508464 RepID=UPI000AC04E5F|nr:lysophospholipid acyltransferase family protein [Nocardia mikamii]